MSESSRKPYQQVAHESKLFTKTMGRFTELPVSTPKRGYVQNLAEDKTADIEFAIARNKYQNQLYLSLEKNDQKQRQKFISVVQQKQKKVDNNQMTLKEKKQKEDQAFQKHLNEVFKKHVELENNKRHQKNDEAYKLRKQLQEFYEKQRQRKKANDLAQIKVGTCYGDAVRRIDQIHRKNEQYSFKSERQYLNRMNRNDGKSRNLLYQTRMKSNENRKKQDIYENNCEIMNETEKKFIQTYCKDLDMSIKAFDHKGKLEEKEKQRLHKFFKQRVQKWHEQKRRVDEQKAEVPRKCIDKLDKTTRASFRHTVSSFKSSGQEWYNRVQQNKSMIYEDNDLKKDRIMDQHLDRRFRNHSSFRVSEQMASMRDRAKKLSAVATPAGVISNTVQVI